MLTACGGIDRPHRGNAVAMTAATSDFTIVNLREIEDQAPGYGVGELQEMRPVRDALDCEQLGLSLQRTKPNQRGAFGHRHERQEEIYVIVAGSGRMKIGDQVQEIKVWDAIRVAATTPRAFEAGADGLDFLAIGAPMGNSGDGEMLKDFWPADQE